MTLARIPGLDPGTASSYHDPATLGPGVIVVLVLVLVVPAVALVATIVHTNRCLRDNRRGVYATLGETTLQEELWRFVDAFERAELDVAPTPGDGPLDPRQDARAA